MKKHISFVLVLVLLISIIPIYVVAAAPTSSLLASESSVYPEEYVTVTVKATCSAPSLGIIPSFDNNAFELVSGEWLTTGAELSDFSDGVAVIAYNVNHNFSGNVFKFTLRAKADANYGNYPISAEVKPEGFDAVKSSVSVIIKCVHTFGAWIKVDDNTHKRVCSKCKEEEIDSHTMELKFNSSSHWQECASCGYKKNVTGHVYDNDCDNTCNICKYERSTNHSFIDTVIPATLTSKGYTKHTCSKCGYSYNDSYTNYNDETPITIKIDDKKVVIGSTFTVDVIVENNKGFSYLEVTPEYSSALQLVSVENGDLISDLTKGVQYIWVADENVTTDGLLLTFTFTTKEDVQPGDYEVGFNIRDCFNYEEQNIGIVVEKGQISISKFVYGDANSDGLVNGQDVVRIKKYLANYDYETETSTVEISAGADANGDGVVNGQDVVRLKKYLANYDYETQTSTIVLGPQK